MNGMYVRLYNEAFVACFLVSFNVLWQTEQNHDKPQSA